MTAQQGLLQGLCQLSCIFVQDLRPGKPLHSRSPLQLALLVPMMSTCTAL